MVSLPFQLLARASAWLDGSAPQSVAEGREGLRRVTRHWALAGPVLPVAQVEEGVVSGVPVRRYRPESARAGLLVFFHGGGWVRGDVETHDRLCRFLARETRRAVVSVEYRRAPEHPYPAAKDDAVAVVRALAPEAPLAVVGDSAGGNLATVAALEASVPLAALGLLYPVLETHEERPSYEAYATGHLLTRAVMREFIAAYLPHAETRKSPGASPLRSGELHRLPPTAVLSAPADVLRSEAEAFAERARAAGVKLEWRDAHGLVHGFGNLLAFARCRDEVRWLAQWLDAQLR
jgi:acetyl esterase